MSDPLPGCGASRTDAVATARGWYAGCTLVGVRAARAAIGGDGPVNASGFLRMPSHGWSLGLLGALLLAVGSARGAARPADDPEAPDLAEVADRIVSQTNAFRKEQGLADVTVEAKLARTARDFADFLARTDAFSHSADGKQPWERAREHEYDDCLVTENIAYQFRPEGFATAELAKGLMQGWKDSTGHRRNLLDRDVTDTGVAVAHSATTGKYYAVQMFGRPMSKTIEVEIANRSESEVRCTVDDEEHVRPARMVRVHRLCRQAALTFPRPEGKAGGPTFQPGPGDRFTVTEEAGQIRVVLEKRPLEGAGPPENAPLCSPDRG